MIVLLHTPATLILYKQLTAQRAQFDYHMCSSTTTTSVNRGTHRYIYPHGSKSTQVIRSPNPGSKTNKNMEDIYVYRMINLGGIKVWA